MGSYSENKAVVFAVIISDFSDKDDIAASLKTVLNQSNTSYIIFIDSCNPAIDFLHGYKSDLDLNIVECVNGIFDSDNISEIRKTDYLVVLGSGDFWAPSRLFWIELALKAGDRFPIYVDNFEYVKYKNENYTFNATRNRNGFLKTNYLFEIIISSNLEEYPFKLSKLIKYIEYPSKGKKRKSKLPKIRVLIPLSARKENRDLSHFNKVFIAYKKFVNTTENVYEWCKYFGSNTTVSYTHLRAPRDQRGSRMPSSA